MTSVYATSVLCDRLHSFRAPISFSFWSAVCQPIVMKAYSVIIAGVATDAEITDNAFLMEIVEF